MDRWKLAEFRKRFGFEEYDDKEEHDDDLQGRRRRLVEEIAGVVGVPIIKDAVALETARQAINAALTCTLNDRKENRDQKRFDLFSDSYIIIEPKVEIFVGQWLVIYKIIQGDDKMVFVQCPTTLWYGVEWILFATSIEFIDRAFMTVKMKM